MGVDITVYVYKYNEEDNKFHRIRLHRENPKTGQLDEVHIYNGRNGEMFNALQNGGGDSYGEIPCRAIRLSSLAEDDAAKLESLREDGCCYGFNEISLYALRQYVREYPKVKDFDGFWDEGEDEKVAPIYKENPIKYLAEEIQYFVEFTNPYGIWHEADYEDYKVIYFFDC